MSAAVTQLRQTAATQAEIRSYEPYAFLNEPFSSYSGTKKAVVHIGLVGNDKLNAFLSKCADNGYIAEVFGTLKGQSTVAVMASVVLTARIMTG